MHTICTIKGPDNAVCVGDDRPLTVIAGPCVLETSDTNDRIADELRNACASAGVQFIFKASFDKANRTSVESPRGPGVRSGLDELARIREKFASPVTTDVHEPAQAAIAAETVDILQIPAFLCRQTDLIVAAGEAAAANDGAVNIKKGQFLSPEEMAGPLGKLAGTGCRNAMLTERGTFFGYHRLVNDFIGLGDLMELTIDVEQETWRPPVCFDCTHSAQLPGVSRTTGGRRERIPLLARAAVAAGVHAVFMECHPEPEQSRSDAGTVLPLTEVAPLIRTLAEIDGLVRRKAHI
ncbi:MAG: 3-deoxy-8-phosphooctulonate synthase [Phycisphaerales bacterium]